MLDYEQTNTLELRAVLQHSTVLALRAGVNEETLKDLLLNLQEFEQSSLRRGYEN